MSEKKENKEEEGKKEEFINPIDPDKITENPGTLEYAHNVGSAVIRPEDMGKQKGRSITSMEYQTDQQLSQIYDQMKLLADQAKKIAKRKEISERIYQATYRFEPVINHVYYLYQTEEQEQILSIIGPGQWGRSKRTEIWDYVATVKLLADHTWEIMDTVDESYEDGDEDENEVEDAQA